MINWPKVELLIKYLGKSHSNIFERSFYQARKYIKKHFQIYKLLKLLDDKSSTEVLICYNLWQTQYELNIYRDLRINFIAALQERGRTQVNSTASANTNFTYIWKSEQI